MADSRVCDPTADRTDRRLWERECQFPILVPSAAWPSQPPATGHEDQAALGTRIILTLNRGRLRGGPTGRCDSGEDNGNVQSDSLCGRKTPIKQSLGLKVQGVFVHRAA